MINYSLSYRNVKVADLDGEGNKQYDTNGDVVKKTVQKAYASAQYIDTLTTEEVCKAVAANGAYSTADIMSIVAIIGKAIIEQVKLGQRVYLGDLGNFYPQLSSKGVEDAHDFNPSAHIKKAYVGWVKPLAMRELSTVTYNLVTTRAAEAELARANASALASATLTQSAATQTAAQNLQTIRASYAITVAVATNMTSMGTVCGGGTYKYGTVVALHAQPNSGYVFTKWADGSRKQNRNVTVSQAATYTAQFAADPGVVGVKLCKSNGDNLTAGTSLDSIRLNYQADTAPASGSLTLKKVVGGVETAVSGAEWSPGTNGVGSFDFDSNYTVAAGTYRVLKGDCMILEQVIA